MLNNIDVNSNVEGLNRNILECKLKKQTFKKSISQRLNRNILECKSTSLPGCTVIVVGLNRNILECKFLYHR